MSGPVAKGNKQHKKKQRLIFRTVVLAVLLVAVIYALASNFTKDQTEVRAGTQAPDFKLEQINKNNEKETIQLSELEGKGVMLNFWGTWCEPCEDEMPYMESLYPEYKEKGVEIIAVNLDTTQFVVDRFINKYDLTFPVPYDSNEEVMNTYQVGPLPTTFFINPEREIVEVVEGGLTLDKIEGYLQQIQPEQ
ncbi:thiol-disulfide oxidoreductase ResA [Lentibacillus amyloliquefaciens]|uniref:Thiol-disulfide oxidoreductase n=1 Tax=Lentibacillus amyloliquefaciens TaxID=1472767 RepID=A0A0U4FQ60_9BACI|nr:thiol-disulfide oxidoreductase ResA [Lentibacillus amyloliquefaciens]ALX47989.1 thiol-disulfide oxidoreductase [Lentibacillus amyloliquefaciens]